MLSGDINEKEIQGRGDICICRADSLCCATETHHCKAIAIIVAQSLSCVWLFATPWTAACQASLSFTISWSLLKFMSIESEMPSDNLILSHPLLLLPPIFPSLKVITTELALCIRWPKYWSFSFSISPFSEYSKLISFRISLSPRDSQVSSPTPQFESIKFLMLCPLYGPALTSVHESW